ncbi:hypothetical protein BXZ70DRAFT_913515 [Cristinia sonorae]|uniref:RPA43 OB domain-containing protein n=1 Tax=Cristinia sonorae TaxID=1940300 RepID=A0A8K0XUV7_9AGAR|nr:hypothetical protein BXZ70DRAFT_913515 [Cristinia sonorae]
MATHTQTEVVAKKRKLIPVEGALGEPSAKRSKTEKQSRKDKKEKKKDKGKAREEDGQFKVVQATMALSIPPIFANTLTAGAEEMLDSMVMRYIPALQGVVLSHSNLQFLDSAATIKADCPFSNIHVGFEATVWCPQIGMKLSGRVNLSSPDHISLLVHRTFNVSIPRRHIPTDNWEFEYGPAENDPEFGAAAAEDDQIADGGAAETSTVEGSGRWVHKITGMTLGGSSGELEFTVIGLTIANQMLSLVGSIQPDPFFVEDEYSHLLESHSGDNFAAASPVDDNAVAALLDDPPSDSEDEEPFDTLNRISNKAIAEEVQRKAEAEESKAEKKRKRKAETDKAASGKKSKS